MYRKKLTISWTFQSTFPRGERRQVILLTVAQGLFQSTFPRGERQLIYRNSGLDKNFNPRSRVGNDDIQLIDTIIHGISIHVPAWGTTGCAYGTVFIKPFQSTFPRGERHLALKFRLLLINFNPRSRVGNDGPVFHVCRTCS